MKQTHYHSHETTIKEYKAPTDESVRLLNEMQHKAAENIIASYRIQNSIIKDGIITFHKWDIEGKIYWKCRININGKDEVISGDYDVYLLKHEAMTSSHFTERYKQIVCNIMLEKFKDFIMGEINKEEVILL